MPKHVEGTRAKLKRLVSLGFLDETEPGVCFGQGEAEPVGQQEREPQFRQPDWEPPT